MLLTSCSGSRQLASQEVDDQPAAEKVARAYTDAPAAGDTEVAHPIARESILLQQDTLPKLTATGDLDRYDSVFLSLEDPLPAYSEALATLDEDTICITATGDIMPGTNYPDERYMPPGNGCTELFDPVRQYLQASDVTFGNLEGVFSGDVGTAKKCRDPSVCYVFRMPDETLDCILNAGYDVLSVANNHVNDFGPAGRDYTARLLEAAGIPFAGFRSRPFITFEKNGLIYGFAAFAPHTGTVSLKDYAGAAEIVAMLDSISDVVIVSFHGGAEGRDHQHVPCTDEIYLGYNRGNVCTFARTVVDAGADVVFGHGPHVIRGMELYKDRLICYSLGNFCTYARFNLSGPNGLAPIVQVFMSPDGTFLEGMIIPVVQPGEGGPRYDPRRQAIHKLQELSTADFPESPLVIEENGRFYAE